jgi:hypothetical protein
MIQNWSTVKWDQLSSRITTNIGIPPLWNPTDTPLGPCVIFSDDATHEHSVKSVHTQRDMIVDSGSTITTMENNGEFSGYIQHSTSGVKMRSATRQVVQPEGKGNITLQADKASLVMKCQHIPAIGSNILSPAETCDTLDYDLYELTCNQCNESCQVCFVNTGSPDITITGTYSLRMPYIRLASTLAMVTLVVPMTYHFPSVLEELLSEENDDAAQRVLRLMHSSSSNTKPSPKDCHNALFHVFCEKLSDNWTHGGLPAAPVVHVLDVVNHTLWHMRMCHPNSARLIIMSKLSRYMTKSTLPQKIKQCVECIIAKMRKSARGHDTGFETTSAGHGLDLAMDVGFMFQKSKNKNRANPSVSLA